MGRKLNFPVNAVEIAAFLQLQINFDSYLVCAASSAAEQIPSSICFAKNAEYVDGALNDCLLICAKENCNNRAGPTIYSISPRLDFARALNFLNQRVGFIWSNVPPVIHPTAVIGKNVSLGNGVTIGAGTKILNNVVIGDEVTIGANCVVKSCAVIGEDGFGFERGPDGKAVRLTHLGRVVIGDDVEIGSLTTVCRGTLGDTIICDGAKIDDHVHVAHNVFVGRDAFVIACAEISGGVRIGERAWIAPNSSVLNQLSVGSDSIVGLGSVVIKSVAPGAVVAGNPAKSLIKI